MSSWRAVEHATALAEVVDPYLDPDTGLLRNLLGARTQDALDRAEGALTYIRAAELEARPVRATGRRVAEIASVPIEAQPARLARPDSHGSPG